ncbi:MAG: DNA-directed RNA polymerase subunit alpha [Candidatus Latescibacteria bacterium]|nr:DNA-directed RNA polymerase subunit alpha [Candidatus Latescibacterota bacterium]NIM20798.1 DNA-directed RNA polymerase subunit alpha [Candidatus Latescibacterota bacterium]NIM64364.1 DNA-directed RNA polymerase subunit alpha [Candidatus Latescibacterota bacterium]NIO00515.1 DNA-directed RNA polymerase subunit alpha [Candidatus Latescibacterota bacterium]NIO26918.1 DNA-directed RNA polymerase subunit alpha [Candidatus Latescibacterota bacterium]
MKWRNLLMPKEIKRDEESLTKLYGRYVVEPLERGFGTTLGNALRRTLLSSIQGAAVTAVRIHGVLHELTNIPGVLEDVTDIILNLKQLVVKMHCDDPRFLKLSVEKEGPVTAGDITEDPEIEILNKDLVLFTATEKTKVELEVLIGHGRGYVPAETHNLDSFDIGLVPVDSNFSPIRKVSYVVEDTRVGQRTDYDKLLLEVTTDGSVTPEDAVGYAAKILKDHMLLFIHFDEEPMEEEEEEVDEELEKLKDLLGRSVEELELSVRSSNCLRRANIKTLGDLVRRTEQEMLKYRNFGKQSLKEISEILAGMNLYLGMDVDAILGGKPQTEEEETEVAQQ